MSEVPGEESPHDDTVEQRGATAYPPPYAGAPGASAPGVSDDELAAALAAQTAMYTGPISIPVINTDPTFRPDPSEVQSDLAPPVGVTAHAGPDDGPAPAPDEAPVESFGESFGLVPPPKPVPDYVAPDDVAADPEASVLGFLEDVPAAAAEPAAATEFPPSSVPANSGPASAPLPDDELSRTVEQEAAASSTLDAILLLENELRRRQGLAPVDDAHEPPADVGAAFGTEHWNASDPSGGAAAEGAAAAVESEPAPAWGSVASSTPGWTEAPDPTREGETEGADASDNAWLTAPPPAFTPPPLVEPPAPESGPVDPATLTPPPVEALDAATADHGNAHETSHATMVDGPDGPVDVSLLPPPAAAAAVAAPGPMPAAPPPSGGAASFAPPPSGEAFAVPDAAGDPDVEGIDDIDRADLAAPVPVDDAGVASVAPAPAPVSTATMVAVGEEPVAPARIGDPSAMAVEKAGQEPTPEEQRAGHAARLFWLWFAANSSIIMVAISATLFTYGMSLRQVLVAVVAGVGLSALPLGLGSLAGKWSGQPTMIVSRATFGLTGNIVPAVLAVLGRVLWGGVLLWLLAMTVHAVLSPGEPDVGLTAAVALAVGAVLAGVVAVLGYGLLHRVQRVLGILSTLLVAATIVVTSSHIDIPTALRTDDGPWILTVGGAVLVFSIVGLAWAQSSSDLARYQKAGGSGAANMLWGSFGVIVPTLAILSWGAILAASSPDLAAELARAPLATLLTLVPDGLELPLLAAAGFGLVAGALVTMYSGGLAILASGARMPRAIATLIAALLVGLVAAALLLLGNDTRALVTDVATTVAVPVAAWTGIFASEMMIRLRRFHAPSLLAAGGIYPSVRWVNLVGLLVITGVGFGFVTAELSGLTWTGYLFPLLGVAADAPLASTDIGVLIALGLGLLLPLVAGVPAIRRQERAVDAPRDETLAPPLVD